LALIERCHGLCTITDGFENARYLGVDADKQFEPTYRHKHHNLPNCITCTKCKKKDDEVCMATLNASCSELKCSDDQVGSVRLDSTSYLQIIHKRACGCMWNACHVFRLMASRHRCREGPIEILIGECCLAFQGLLFVSLSHTVPLASLRHVWCHVTLCWCGRS
jgi:hypothetical protein